MSHDARIDDYIARQSAFARPILLQLRERVHSACPEVDETLKWGMPSFLYRGKILAGMAAFKAHATFGFWHGDTVLGEEGKATAMGQFGRLTRVEDLPDDATLAGLIRDAMALIDGGVKAVRTRTVRKVVALPGDLADALASVPAAQATYQGFAPSCRREYHEWVVEAKRPQTRAKRIAQAVEMMAQGKKRHWKYQDC